jgi:hypothetical protein
VSSKLTITVRAALCAAPANLHALARAAGVPLRTLTRIQRGELEASPAVARALARVLARWGTGCGRAGRRLLVTRGN